MNELVKKQFALERPGSLHDTILSDCKNLVSLSRNKMKEFYPTWDRNDDTYRSVKGAVDKDDIAARERKEPEKMVVPIAYSQLQTFVSFVFNLYTQRERFFELEGYTAEDDRPAKVGEALLARDLSKNIFEAKLSQYLLDIGRFGIGVMKCSWTVESNWVTQTEEITSNIMGGQEGQPQVGGVSPVETEVEQVTFEGNTLTNISPYRFFPDTRLPLSRFQEGEFCASEEIYSMAQLRKWEADGVVVGVDHIKSMSKEAWNERHRLFDDTVETDGKELKGDGQVKKSVIVTEVQRDIVPADYKIDDKPLGPEKFPIKYVIWYANDNRVIKCEPMGYAHNQFTYGIAQFSTDNNQFISGGLSDIIDNLQAVITWFINARITNVRKIISDKLIVNTQSVNMDDINNRRPVIRLKAAATGGIDNHIKQLQLSDVTQSHVGDAKYLNDLIKEMTGISDTLLGQVKPGKRSATENRNTTSGSATRLKTIAAIIFRTGLEPLGRQMLSNLRDGLDNLTYVKAIGQKALATPEFIEVTKQDLVGNYDFEIFDGTLPSERQFSAQAIQEIVTLLIQNPQLASLLGMDVRKLFMEMMILRGIKNPERFLVAPQPVQPQQVDANGQPIQPGQSAPTGDPTGAPPTQPIGADPAALAGVAGGPATGFPPASGQPILPFPVGGVGQ